MKLMKLKKAFWSIVNKTVSHNDFRDIFQHEFQSIRDPSLNNELKKAFSHNLEDEYPDLQKDKHEENRTPIFITARFRSGSTLLWNILRQIDELHCYYEPLNERMWFDQAARQKHTDSSHKGVDNYWEEYNHIENVSGLFTRDWTYKRLIMDSTSFDPNLYAYIKALIDQSPSIPVLQFNRVDYRLPWLKANFNNSKIIHMYRHPRDQWLSVSRNSILISHDLTGHDLSRYNIFYTIEWARNLSSSFPFLDPNLGQHPYYYHYLLWRLSYIYGKTYSGLSISYEDLITDTNSTLTRVIEYIGVSNTSVDTLANLINTRSDLGKWKSYANSDWYSAIESQCDSLLEKHFCLENSN